MQPSPSAIFRTWSHDCNSEPMKQIPTPTAPGCHHSTSCLYEFGYSKYLFIGGIMQYLSSCGFFHLVKCFQDPAVFGMLQNSLPFQGWIIFHCMWVGGVLNFQSCCMPLSLTSQTCPVTESEMPGARVGFTLSTWRVTPFLCVLFPLPSLFLFFHLCFRLFFFLSLFLSFFQG